MACTMDVQICRPRILKSESDHINGPMLIPATITMSSTTKDAGHSGGYALDTMDKPLDSHDDRLASKVNHLLHNTLPWMHVTHESTCRLPYEIVEMIVAHLTRDYPTLKACSLTCHSWYIVAVSHLHHTLTLGSERYGSTPRKELKRLSKLHELGLIPFVKEIRVFPGYNVSDLDLQYFSAFTNVHTLCLQEVDISCFIAGIERDFGHFSLSLRSIELYAPHCTPRQLPYFLSLFPNLDDIEIIGSSTNPTILDTDLAPFSEPKLRGRLRLLEFRWVETWTYLITSCGGLRFRHIDLWRSTNCAPTLLEACAETLETLRFHVTDGSYGSRSVSFPEFNLSRLKVLRSLQVKGWVTGWARPDDHRDAFVMEVFTTITSPEFSEVVIITLGYRAAYLLLDVMLFETLRKMNEIRPFKLVFSPNVPENHKGRRELAKALDLLIAIGYLDFFDSPPTLR